MEGKKLLFKHTFIYFIGKLTPAILSLIGVMIFTRMVQPEVYGLFSLLTVISGLINILFFQWLRSSLLRFYNDREKISLFFPSLLKSYITVLFIALLIIILFITLSLTKVINVDIRFLLIIYVAVTFLSAFEMCVVYFRTILKPKIVVGANVIRSVSIIIFSFILLCFGTSVWGLLFGSICGTIIGIVYFFKKVPNNNFKRIKVQADKNTQIKFLKYGLPITISFSLSVALQNIDKIMISSILGLEANGNYAVGFDLMHNIIYMLMTSISLAGFPIILKVIKEKGNDAGKTQFKKYVELLLLIAIPACFGLASVLNEITTLVIGDSYSISKHLLILIIIASLIHGIKSYYFDLTLQVTTKTRFFFIPALVAIIVNIIMNFFLLNKYHIEGAAISTVLAFFVAMMISAYYSIKNYHLIFPFVTTFKILISSILMYILISNISVSNVLISLHIKILLGIVLYLILSIVLNIVGVREIIISKVLKKVKR